MSHEDWMDHALAFARKAAELDEVPVGAVFVYENRIVAVAHNERESGRDPTAHAEILALKRASQALGRWRLSGGTLYVTLEPCPMCAGALVNARVDRLVYGASDPKAGAVGSLYNIVQDERLNHQIEVIGGVSKEECAKLLTAFFRAKRARAKLAK